MKTPDVHRAVPFGILSGEDVRTGDHIAYFWESEQEFDRGVQFLLAGLEADATASCLATTMRMSACWRCCAWAALTWME